VALSAGEEVALGREKGGDDASWVDVNLNGLKIIKIHTIDLAATNEL
jgi:hypothetical protein